MTESRRGQAGFSLIELMVALVVTMIIVGAMYGLLADSQTGFRREPERTDRQQNIRAAMDMIMRDIGNAGSGLPELTQVFTSGLDACSGCPDGGAPMGLNSIRTDELEMVTNDDSLENEPASTACASGATSVLFARDKWNPPTILPFTVAVVFADHTWSIRNVTAPPTSGAGCTTLTLGTTDPSGLNNGNYCDVSATGLGNATCASTVSQVGFPQLIRYRIRVVTEGSGSTSQNVPVLQRIDESDPANRTQVVARGIEDLQVRYIQAGAGAACTAAAPCDNAPAVTWSATPAAADFGKIVTRVVVTLSSRSMLRGRIQGQSYDATGGTALRGSLTVSGTPRSSLLSVTQQPVPDPSTSPAIWQ